MRKTNPIWRPGAQDCGLRIEKWRLRANGGGRMRKTNPICPAGAGRSSLAPPASSPRRRRLCKTNPISGQPGGWGRSIVQNKANLPAVILALSAFEKGVYQRRRRMVSRARQSQLGGVKLGVSSVKSKKASDEPSDFRLHTS
jgi:hypothetical protein